MWSEELQPGVTDTDEGWSDCSLSFSPSVQLNKTCSIKNYFQNFEIDMRWNIL